MGDNSSRIRSDLAIICQRRTCPAQIFGHGSFFCTCTLSLCLPPPPSPTLDSHLASVASWASSPHPSSLPPLPFPHLLTRPIYPTRPIWCPLPDGTRLLYSHQSLLLPSPHLSSLFALLYSLLFFFQSLTFPSRTSSLSMRGMCNLAIRYVWLAYSLWLSLHTVDGRTPGLTVVPYGDPAVCLMGL